MHISEVMSADVKIASPKQSIQDAAQMMMEIDAGAIPVGEGDRLVGMITDRDIAVRAVAAGKPANTPIADVMSHEVKYCFESDDIDTVAANMADLKLRRLPVVNRQKRLVGIVSLGDIALSGGPDDAATALSGISEPGGEHSQSEPGVHGLEVVLNVDRGPEPSHRHAVIPPHMIRRTRWHIRRLKSAAATPT